MAETGVVMMKDLSPGLRRELNMRRISRMVARHTRVNACLLICHHGRSNNTAWPSHLDTTEYTRGL